MNTLHRPPPPAVVVDSSSVLDALCATHDHRLDALPDLLGAFAGKEVVNKQLTGQLHPPPASSPFAHALDTSDPTDRAVAFAINGRMHNLLLGISSSSMVRSRRSSAASARSRHSSLDDHTLVISPSAPGPDPGAPIPNDNTCPPNAV